MRKVILGRTKQPVSAVSLGTWAFGGSNMSGKIPVGWSGQSNKNSTAALIKAWESEINHWDTADVYGEGQSEKVIGRTWIDIPRSEIILATKVGWDKGPYSYWYNPKQMKNNMERSLRNLKTEYVDIMYMHHCNFGKNNEYFDDAMYELKKFKEEGKARFLGLSDWSSRRILKFIDQCDPDVVQTYRNVMDDDYKSSGLKSYINNNNIGVCFFSPLKHGLLTGKYKKPESFEPGDHRSSLKDFSSKKLIEKMIANKVKLEKKYSKEKNPVIFALVNSLFFDSPTGCVLLGQRNTNQVEVAASLGKIIPEDDAKWIKSLFS